MMNLLSTRRVSYQLSLWAERPHGDMMRWRGSLETIAGQRFDFTTLAELERLLCEIGGWNDPLNKADLAGA